MGLLQPKPEKTAIVSVRVTASLKRQIADLRAELTPQASISPAR